MASNSDCLSLGLRINYSTRKDYEISMSFVSQNDILKGFTWENYAHCMDIGREYVLVKTKKTVNDKCICRIILKY